MSGQHCRLTLAQHSIFRIKQHRYARLYLGITSHSCLTICTFAFSARDELPEQNAHAHGRQERLARYYAKWSEGAVKSHHVRLHEFLQAAQPDQLEKTHPIELSPLFSSRIVWSTIFIYNLIVTLS